ncbi:MAG: metallophosphoesterase [Clostridia bacterium]|nr:metallophosphoesterase [Clostridia bacterium]
MIFSIADLHLSGGDKPMDVFGSHWENHFERIRTSWLESAGADDIVLLPGDLSWAMRLEDAQDHLHEIGSLPGRKVILRGNHDYWWSAIGKVRAALPEGMYAVQNDALLLDGTLICGSRGWLLPGADCSADDKKIFERELIRLEMSLKKARALSAEAPLIVMLHFPPLTVAEPDTAVTALLEQYAPQHVVYGHLHGPATRAAFTGEHNGIEYHLVSCDALGFKLRPIL